MKKIIIIFIMSLFMLSIVNAENLNEVQWDGKGIQTLTLWEKIMSNFVSGATIPTSCELRSHTQRVFDTAGKTSYTSVGNSCSSGDYIALFNCGLSSRYSSSAECNYGNAIREGYNPLQNVDVSPTNRYMYMCYTCQAITTPTNFRYTCGRDAGVGRIQSLDEPEILEYSCPSEKCKQEFTISTSIKSKSEIIGIMCEPSTTGDCIDSDGSNIYTKGWITKSGGVALTPTQIAGKTDSCNGNSVIEWTCVPGYTTANARTLNCNLGCKDGACLTSSCEDKDNDGYGISSSTGCSKSGVDCDDNNYNVRPNRDEVCNNNQDDNCNAQVDEGCVKTCEELGGECKYVSTWEKLGKLDCPTLTYCFKIYTTPECSCASDTCIGSTCGNNCPGIKVCGTCTADKDCTTLDNCEGTQKCVNGKLGDCIKKSPNCGILSCKQTTSSTEINQKLQLTTTDKNNFINSHKCTQSPDCCDEKSGVMCIPSEEANKWGFDWNEWFFTKNEGFCLKDIPQELCYGCIDGKVDIQKKPCPEGFDTIPITKCGENNTKIIEEPKSPSLPIDKWEKASSGMRIKTVCSITDNCAEYKDLSGSGKEYAVSCEATQDIMTRLELDYKDQCKTSLYKKISSSITSLLGAGCIASIGLTVLCLPTVPVTMGAFTPLCAGAGGMTFAICSAETFAVTNQIVGCAIWGQPDISKGACIAVPKAGEPLSFCFSFTKSVGRMFSKDASDKDACAYGWVAIALFIVLFLVILSRLTK